MAATTSQEIVTAAEEIEKHTARIQAAAVPDPKQLCEIYNKIKGPLNLLLTVIALIPVYGAAVAKGLQTLMGIADQLCPRS
jgi:type IV secretory pathway VirB2 component (pilin)